MKRRAWLLLIGLAMGALSVVAADSFFVLRPGITESNIRRIRKGMTPEHVERLMGGAADYQWEATWPNETVVTMVWDTAGVAWGVRVIFLKSEADDLRVIRLQSWNFGKPSLDFHGGDPG